MLYTAGGLCNVRNMEQVVDGKCPGAISGRADNASQYMYNIRIVVYHFRVNTFNMNTYSRIWFIQQHLFPLNVSDKPGVG